MSAQKKEKSSLTIRQADMLKALQETRGNVSQALRIAGVSSRAYYDWVDGSPEFRYALRMVQKVELDECVEEIRRRAVEGVPSTKFYKGRAIRDPVTKKPYVERQYSDGLLKYRTQVLARKLGLAEFEDRQQVNVELGKPITDRIDRLVAAISGGSAGAGVEPAGEALPEGSLDGSDRTPAAGGLPEAAV